MPKLGMGRNGRLTTIPGTVPDLINLPTGCTFTDRCPLATSECRNTVPVAFSLEAAHKVSCHHLDQAIEARGEGLYK